MKFLGKAKRHLVGFANITIQISFFFALLGIESSYAEEHLTKNYWECVNRSGGQWVYGRVPSVCSANSYGGDVHIEAYYPELIFNDLKRDQSNVSSYMNVMHAVIRDAARYYIQARKEGVGSEEIEAWTRAILAMASHESRWSHYRRTENQDLKFVRGDYGHGHGLLQIDDRWHFPTVKLGRAWDLVGNLHYGMGEFYREWQLAESSGCLPNKRDWKRRARTAYSKYNGGPGALCRWTKARSKNASKDAQFLYQYENQPWLKYTSNLNEKAPLSLACMIEEGKSCRRPASTPTDTKAAAKAWAGALLRTPENSVCVVAAQGLHCVTDERDAGCLGTFVAFDPKRVLQLTQKDIEESNSRKFVHDRHTLCHGIEGLQSVGSFITAEKAINLRAAPLQGILGVVPAGTSFQVLDFEVRDPVKQDRYYKIKFGRHEGYIYGGEKRDYHRWASPQADASSARVWMPPEGGRIQVRAKTGINLRSTPGGKPIIGRVPFGAKLKVVKVEMRGDSNQIFLEVDFGSKSGFIYAGMLLPKSTVELWVGESK